MEVGDLIVCVNNGEITGNNGEIFNNVFVELSINKVYKILKIEDFFNREVVFVLNDKNIERGYNIKRFKTLSEIRLEKLNELGYGI